MKELNFNINGITLTQKFFAERGIELLYRGTIDSYRVQTMNPYSVLMELLALINGYKKGKIKDFKTVVTCIDEVQQLLTKEKEDSLLSFEPFDSDYFSNLLTNASKSGKDHFIKDHFSILKNCIKIILQNNKGYLSNLVDKIETLLVSDTQSERKEDGTTDLSFRYHHYYKRINRLIGFLLSGLVYRGYSKSFLFRYFHAIFVYNNENHSFIRAFEEIKVLVNSEVRPYRIWFKVESRGVSTIDLFGNCTRHENLPEIEVEEDKRAELTNFGKTNNGKYKFIEVSSKALDYYTALHKAKYLIAENLDIINLGFGTSKLNLIDKAFVQDTTNLIKADFHSIHYELDGYYKTGRTKFEEVLQKIPSILGSKLIAEDSKEKIKSAIRYLRMGNEAIEIEHSFVNYWVGLEYIFSNYKDSSFTRIKNYLSIIETIIYVKRNLAEYFNNCKKMTSEQTTTVFSDTNFDCLKLDGAYDEIKTIVAGTSPLLSYRSSYYKSIIFSNDRRGKYIKNHQERLKQHLIRLYRVRNEIIHEAKFNFVSEGLTSNLKYYLMTTLSLIVNHFEIHINQNPNASGKFSIDDFFIVQDLKLAYWAKQDYKLDLILNSGENFDLLG